VSADHDRYTVFVDHLGGAVLDLDSYYFDRSALPPHERSRLNYDEPAAIDAALLVEHLARLGRGEPVSKSMYAFSTHERVGVETVFPAPIVIVEGLSRRRNRTISRQPSR
jgi:uridine kinase